MNNSTGRNIGLSILPVLVFFAIQNGIYIMGLQIGMAVRLWQDGPVDARDLSELVYSVLTEPFANYVMTLISGLVGLVIFVIWYRKLSRREKPVAKEADPDRSDNRYFVIPGILLIGFGFQYAGTFLIEILARIFPEWAQIYQEVMETAGIDVTGTVAIPVAVAIYAAVFAPLVEELCLRGLCITYARRSLPIWAANLFSSFLFALLHANILQGIYTFIFGLVLGYIFAKTEKIWIPIAVHILFNSISLFVPQILVIAINPVINFVILSLSMIAVYIGIRLVLKAYARD